MGKSSPVVSQNNELVQVSLNEFNIGGVSALNIYNKLMRNDKGCGFLSINTFGNVIPDYLFDIESSVSKELVTKGFYSLDKLVYNHECSKKYSWELKELPTKKEFVDQCYDLYIACAHIRQTLEVSRNGYTQNHYYPMVDRPMFNLGFVIYKVLIDSELYKFNDQLERSYNLLKDIFNYERKR